MARDNANLTEQLRANQEQLTRGVARLSEQLKTSQEQMLRDNANVAEQIKAIQDQLARVISQASEQNAPPRIAAAATTESSRGAQADAHTLVATSHGPADGRKTKIVIDLAAAGARALGALLHRPLSSPLRQQAANCRASTEAVL